MTTTVAPSPTRRLGTGTRVALVAALVALASVGFLTLGVRSNLAFVMELRLPKLASMVLVGWATGIATVAFQTVTHNRLLTPSIMGLDALYVFLQTMLVVVLGVTFTTTIGAVPMFALTTALILVATLGLVTLLFGRERRSVHVLVLAGLVLGAVLRSASTLLQRVLDPTSYLVLQQQLFASFTLVDPTLLWVSAGVVALVSVWLVRQAATLDVVLLGHDPAVSLGVPYRRVVRRVMLASVLLVAVSTALVGPITFLGLIVAAIANLVGGTAKHRILLPMAGALGALLLVGGQTVLEHGFGMATVLSVVVEFVGGIVFIWLVVRSGK